MIGLINRPADMPSMLLALSSIPQTLIRRIPAVDKPYPYQGIVTATGLVGALSTPRLSTLSTM